jgi:hypothetical protein
MHFDEITAKIRFAQEIHRVTRDPMALSAAQVLSESLPRFGAFQQTVTLTYREELALRWISSMEVDATDLFNP